MGMDWATFWCGLPAALIDAQLAAAADAAVKQIEAMTGKSIRREAKSVRRAQADYLKKLTELRTDNGG